MEHVMEETNELIHYGMPRRSGRYPWGSGDDPYQHSRDFLGRVDELKKSGWKETPENIMEEFGLTSTQYRTEKRLAKNDRRMLQVSTAKSLKEDGLGYSEIGRRMGVNESTVRSLLEEKSESNMMAGKNTAEFLKARLAEVNKTNPKAFIDVGKGVERELNVSKETLNEALYILEREGYVTGGGRVPQPTNPGQMTTLRGLFPKDTPYKINEKGQMVTSELYKYENMSPVKDYTSHDGGETFDRLVYPKSMDSKRLMVRYAEDGGVERDGLIELRRNVPDLSLDGSRYSQVRILVDNDRYLKGMAAYSDDMPDGVDVIFNTNKSKDVPVRDVLKPIKNDPDNPFGATIKPNGQNYYVDENGVRQLGLINKKSDEGDWSEWKDALPSQFLSKQSQTLAKKQLDLTYADRTDEFESYKELTNPTIKKHLLRKFADECDSAAVHLKAAALPGQKYHVIVPINTLSDNEVYAPGYPEGSKLALVRYPHGGIFEIPVLTVTHKNSLAKNVIGTDSMDGIGITAKNAERLSGADFDGDTVMCIPTDNGKVRITRSQPLKGLEGFDPKTQYAEHEGMRYMKNPVTGKDQTQKQMGMISNLITDMTLAGAGPDELAAAVRHSMVVIDAGKHKLDYKQSEIDNNILALKKRYQRKVDPDGTVKEGGGASTLISRAKGEVSVNKRQGNPHVDPVTGKLIYKDADDLYYVDKTAETRKNKETGKVEKTGKTLVRTIDGKKIAYDPSDPEARERYAPVKKVDPDTGEVRFTNKTGDIEYRALTRKQQSTNMAETDDAYTLVSEARHPMEIIYADHANRMKALANTARLEVLNTGKIAYSASAKAVYQDEVRSLDEKLNIAELNAPRERIAAVRTAAEVNAKKAANKDMSKSDIKKANQQAMNRNRIDVGAVARSKRSIEITDREWEAIQAGAISESKLTRILNNTNIDSLRTRATPRTRTTVSQARIAKMKNMSASGYSLNDIAKACNLDPSTVSKYLRGVN